MAEHDLEPGRVYELLIRRRAVEGNYAVDHPRMRTSIIRECVEMANG